MNSNTLFRVRIVSLCIACIGVIIIGRLFHIQVLNKDQYDARADRQYFTPSNQLFERGTIYFTQKDGRLFSAATIMNGFKVAITPRQITDATETYNALSRILQLEKEEFIKKANQKNDPYEEIAWKISKEDADKVTALGLKGVAVHRERWRFYPGTTLAAHTIGFVAYRDNDLVGRYGIERSYESTLSRSAETPYVNFFAEVFANVGRIVFQNDTQQGDIVLTIEPSVQALLESELEKLMTRWNGESVGGVVIHPQTGAIYALASHPTFNSNEFSTYTGSFSNPLVESVYELGSVIKPLVVAAGLDTGTITADTMYLDEGTVTVRNRVIKNFDGKGRGRVTMQTVLDQSLNTGMVYIAQKLGKEQMRSYLYGFGLDKKSGIDLPGDIAGLTGNLRTNGDVEFANASFGQGIAITPVVAARAFSALANGGYLITPHVAQKVNYGSSEKVFEYPKEDQVIRTETSEEITRMLVHVFDGYNAGKTKLDRYQVAGKTGTAQIALENGRGYYDDRNMHSFFGYFPASNPQFLVYLYIRHPKGVRFASQTLIAPFSNMASFLLNYYEVAPDR